MRIYYSPEVYGLEKIVDLIFQFLRITIVSDWIRFWLHNAQLGRRYRDRVIEVFILLELVLLIVLLLYPENTTITPPVIAAYILYCLFINLFNIVVVGKLDVLPQTSSVERSLLIFIINAAEIVVAFSILYRYWFTIDRIPALFYALLVFGTLGHPVETNPLKQDAFDGALLVGAQISVDVTFLAIFVSAFVGRLKAFDRMRERKQDEQSRPLVIVVFGLPTTGKTTLCRALSEKLNIPWSSADDLANVVTYPPESNPYRNEESREREQARIRIGYKLGHAAAEACCVEGRSFIFEAVYSKENSQRFMCDAVARTRGRIKAVLCTYNDTDEEVARRIDARRTTAGYSGSCDNVAHYYDDKARFTTTYAFLDFITVKMEGEEAGTAKAVQQVFAYISK